MQGPRREFWKGKRVCVTGGTGFLGYHLLLQLRNLGARLRSFSLPPRPSHPVFNEPDVERVFGDLCNRDDVRRAAAGCEVILHTAGTVAVWGPALLKMHSVHFDGTRNTIDAAEEGARIVHTSSIVAVGASQHGEVFDEESSFNLDRLRVDYVHAKRSAEAVALQAGTSGRDVVVANPGYLIGPDDYECSVMGRFCLRFWKGRMLVAPTGGVNLVDVRDVANGILLAAEHGRSGRRYILGGENQRMKSFMRQLAQAAGMRPRALPVVPTWPLRAFAALAEGRALLTGREPYPSFQHVRMNRFHWFVTSERARTELGYVSRPLADTLANTHRWYSESGLLSLRRFNRWWMRPDSRPNQAA
jgi:dihydroflavonol-4-reductase